VIEVYDSEILEIEAVVETLKQRSEDGRRLDRGQFDREIIDRFAKIGFEVTTQWFHTDLEDVKMPEVTIVGRLGSRQSDFDHDQMAHEVTSDVLGLGQGGVIKTTTDDTGKIKAVEQGHKHSSDCGH
jgi:hypothetical protein